MGTSLKSCCAVMGVLAGLVLAGCGGGNTPGAPAPTGTPTPAVVINTPTAAASPTSAPAATTAAPDEVTLATAFTNTPLPGLVEIPDVPTYPGILKSTRVHAVARSVKCGNPQSYTYHGYAFVNYDVSYSVDYGKPGLSRDEKLKSPVNQQIVDFYHQQFAAKGWQVTDETDETDALVKIIAWDDEERAATPEPGQDAYDGACYVVTVLVQPASADLHIIAIVGRDE